MADKAMLCYVPDRTQITEEKRYTKTEAPVSDRFIESLPIDRHV
jgi:hypothetical protein